jgi:phage/plasmid-associated DNA primase
VQAATRELFTANDALGEFFSECVTIGNNEKVNVTEFRSAYMAWCFKEAAEPFKPHTFNRMLEDRGYKRKDAVINNRVVKCWHGFTLSAAGKQLIASEEAKTEQVKARYQAVRAARNTAKAPIVASSEGEPHRLAKGDDRTEEDFWNGLEASHEGRL